MKTLADALFDRHDREAVDTVAVCIVDLPAALLGGRHKRKIDAPAALRGALAAAWPRPHAA